LYDVFCRTSSYQSYISLLSDDDDDNLEDNDDDLQAALQARLAEARYCFSVYVHPFFTFGTRPPFCSTHSLTAALDQLRVVASSTSNDPGSTNR